MKGACHLRTGTVKVFVVLALAVDVLTMVVEGEIDRHLHAEVNAAPAA
jgi:hypothetical protein